MSRNRRSFGDLNVWLQALAARARAVTYGLEKRRQTLAQSWGRVFEVERDRVSDASTAWRHCFMVTWERLKELFENACCDHDRMEKYWQDKVRRHTFFSFFFKLRVLCGMHIGLFLPGHRHANHANIPKASTRRDASSSGVRSQWWKFLIQFLTVPPLPPCVETFAPRGKWALELERSRALAETIGEEKQRLEHQQSLFAVTLTDVVADATVAEADALASARCLWWQEAREGFLTLFSTVMDTLSFEGNTEEALDADAANSARVRHAIVLRLDGITREDDMRSAAAMAAIVAENGPLRHAEEEQDQRCRETIDRCHSAVNAAVEHRSCPSNNLREAMTTFGPGGDDSALLHPDVREDLQRIRSLLEKEAVERATASLEGETRKLAMEANEEPCPSRSDTPSELTRSQLDLRRVARVRAGSRVLGNVLFRAHDVILEAKRDVSICLCPSG